MHLFHKVLKTGYLSIAATIVLFQFSCKKLVDVGPPTQSITTEQTFSDSLDASSAIQGIYARMINNGFNNIGSGLLTVYCGMSADELLPFASAGEQLYNNTLVANNGKVYLVYSTSYQAIYAANAAIEGLQSSKGITENAKKLMTGEARFLRAYYYFYMVNLFGDVPLATSSDYRVNAIMARTPKAAVYDTILADLKYAEAALPTDYSYSNGERTRVNSSAATALLARTYLYLGRWDDAIREATIVINNTGQFTLSPDLDQIFLANSSEAILQLRPNTGFNPFNSLPEAYAIIPPSHTYYPSYYLTDVLKGSFEDGDVRKEKWLDSTKYAGQTYYYPFKYKVGPAQRVPNSDPTEYYTLLRLAEQYLIRAEAEIQKGMLTEAVADINVIRNRALLNNTTASTKEELIAAIAHERQIELFAESGARWLDLKRTGQIDSVMNAEKANWRSYQQLYPIATSERQINPNLTQNPGY